LLKGAQGPPPPYPNQQINNNGALPNKRFKPGEEPPQGAQGVRAAQPPFYLSQQQLQMLQYLQQQTTLSPQQQAIFQQLTSQYRLMQQHQQQLRLQQQRAQQVIGQSGQGVVRPQGQQFPGQPGYQQTARVPVNKMKAYTCSEEY